jgi:hypothetical protein
VFSEASTLNIAFTSLIYSLAATVYYKRSFSREKLKIVVPLCILAIILDFVGNPLLTILVIIEASLLIQSITDVFKSLSTSMFLTLLISIMDIRGCMMGPSSWTAYKMIFVAIPQFIRKPDGLKTRLQGVRSHLGPAYVLLSLKLALYEHELCGEFVYAVMATAVMAGTLFRPDNGVILDLLGIQSRHQDRKMVHGRSMCISLMCLLISLVL